MYKSKALRTISGQEIADNLRNWIRENYGERCRDVSSASDCITCNVWMCFDEMETHLITELDDDEESEDEYDEEEVINEEDE